MKIAVESILDALPQTQCKRCGFPDCESYAQAVAYENVPINQCPPGGEAGIARLSHITGKPATPLNPVHGKEGPRSTVWIDETVCIGCTLCLDACPTDAILGTNKKMHTVIQKYCTGCELCLPVCPVDCILVENATPRLTAWQAWSQAQADQARERFTSRKLRLERESFEHNQRLQSKALEHLNDLDASTHMPATDSDDSTSDYERQISRKTAIIQAALEKAKALNKNK